MPIRRVPDLVEPVSTRFRLGAVACGLTLSGLVLAGCASSDTAAAAKADASTARSAAGGGLNPATAGGSDTRSHAITPKAACQVISLNLGVLTRVATSPNDLGLDRGIKQLRDLGDTAPVEIRDDLQVIADFDQGVLRTVRAGGSPDAIQETPRLTAALAHEASWTTAHCSQ